MLTDEEFLAHTFSASGETLTHYGVPGMRWGKRKPGESKSDRKQANRATLKAHGEGRLAKSGGSAAKANTKSIGKMLLTNMVSNMGGNAVINLSKGNPSVALGVGIVSGIVQGVAIGKTVNEIRSVNEANRDN